MKNLEFLKQNNACSNGYEFASKYPILLDAWNNCERGDWMLWLAKKLDVDIQVLTLAKAHCANTIRHLMKDERSRNAVDIAIKFGEGIVTIEELNASAAAAYAAYAASAAYASASADAYAASAAAAAADAASAVADAAAAASAAASAYAAYASRIKNRKETADICRKYLTITVTEKLNEY
jgi:regulator of protease activity HflC (stomatin/prohibitin superfamily)